jgi:hypothetical protein
MAAQVEVAALTLGQALAFEAPFDVPGTTVAWEDRPRVTLDVETDETLGSVLARAANELGLTVSPASRPPDGDLAAALSWVAFKLPEDRTAVRTPVSFDIALVRDDGLLWWHQDFRSARYEEILRTTETGVLRGDSTRVYLILDHGFGNGVLLPWAVLIGAFVVLRGVLATLSDVEGSIALVKRLTSRANAASEAVEEEFPQFTERAAQPLDLHATLGTGPWHASDLGDLLGCSSERAEGILQGYGFGQDSKGLWRLEADEEARFMHGFLNEVRYAYSDVPSARPEQVLHERLEEYIRSGKRPELPEGYYGPNLNELSEEDAIARWDEDVARWKEGDALAEDELGDDEFALPLEHLEVRCACGQGDCEARLTFNEEGDKIRLKFVSGPTDHFVISPSFLMQVGMSVLPDE